MCGIISGLSILLHLSPICLCTNTRQFFLNHYFYVIEREVSDSESRRSSFIVENSLTILGCSVIPDKDENYSLWRIELELWWGLHWICRLLLVRWPFLLLILPIHELGRSFHLLRFSISFFRVWKVLFIQIFNLLG